MHGCSPSSPAGPRFWRPAAQRTLKNSWSSIFTQLSAWSASSLLGFSAASSFVNSILSSRYAKHMDFGVLTAMNDIQSKTHEKLFYHGEAFFGDILTSFKSLVDSLFIMQKAQGSMRAYLKSPVMAHLIEFSDQKYLEKDAGDGDGLAVFSTLSINTHEMLARELLDMFLAEIKTKWIIILELHSIFDEKMDNHHPNRQDLKKVINEIYAEAVLKLPSIFDAKVQDKIAGSAQQGAVSLAKRELLQVFLTAWVAEVNIQKNRKEEIVNVISEEMEFVSNG